MLSKIEILWHIEAIKKLKARYFRALDSKDWTTLCNTFTREIVILNSRAGEEHRTTRDRHIEHYKWLIGEGRSIHHGYTPEITILDEANATGIWAMDDIIVYPPRDKPQGFRGWGHYHETYKVEDGEWHIAVMDLRRMRYEPLIGGLPSMVRPSLDETQMIWGIGV
jgi:hypothetical protein